MRESITPSQASASLLRTAQKKDSSTHTDLKEHLQFKSTEVQAIILDIADIHKRDKEIEALNLEIFERQ
jgi:hypothetical protein